MNEYEAKLRRFMVEHGIEGEHLIFDQSCHSVAEAAAAAQAQPEDLVKNICMLDDERGELIVAIVKGEDRASTSRVGKALNAARPRLATPEEILRLTGYPCGGTPSFGFPARFLIDPRVIERGVIYTGGGSPNSLVRTTPQALLRASAGLVARVRP